MVNSEKGDHSFGFASHYRDQNPDTPERTEWVRQQRSLWALEVREEPCIGKLHDPRQVVNSQFPHLSNEAKNAYQTGLFWGSNESVGVCLPSARPYTNATISFEWRFSFFIILCKPATKIMLLLATVRLQSEYRGALLYFKWKLYIQSKSVPETEMLFPCLLNFYLQHRV